jgi:hypothetical protein
MMSKQGRKEEYQLEYSRRPEVMARAKIVRHAWYIKNREHVKLMKKKYFMKPGVRERANMIVGAWVKNKYSNDEEYRNYIKESSRFRIRALQALAKKHRKEFNNILENIRRNERR